MDKRTRETEDEMLAALEDDLGLTVTEINIAEYIRGDPTDPDATVTGAEIDLKVYVSLDEADDDTNRFRYDP